MHFIKGCLSVFVLCCFVSSATARVQSQTVEFKESDFVFGERTIPPFGTFDTIRGAIPDIGGASGNAGLPDLPVYSFFVSIPPEHEVESVEVKNSKTQELDGVYNIVPRQLMYANINVDPETGEIPPVPPDPIIYDSPNPYPGEIVRSHGFSFIGGNYPVAVVSVSAVARIQNQTIEFKEADFVFGKKNIPPFGTFDTIRSNKRFVVEASGNTGAPVLPAYLLYISIPPEHELASVELKGSKTERIPGEFLLWRFQNKKTE